MLFLTLNHMFDAYNGRYSILTNSDDFDLWIMEREWNFNRRFVSCVPRDEYEVVRHNGSKYKNTFAVIGAGVGHYQYEKKARYACVFHQAVFPSQVEGCFAPAHSIDSSGHTVRSKEATDKLLAFFDRHIGGGIRILCQ